jgi:hypothetical protein
MNAKKIKSTFVYLVCILFANSCIENYTPQDVVKDSPRLSQTTGTIANYVLDGKEGDAISVDVASRWIANYSKKNDNKTTDHYFGSKSLLKMVNKKESVGIRFYYSKDDNDINHLLAIPVDGRGNDFSFRFVPHGLNSSLNLSPVGSKEIVSGLESDSVTFEKARHLINNFRLKYPSGIVGHFFGYEIIKQILSQSNCVGIRCYPALDDKGVQQLVLIGVNNNGVNILHSGNNVERKTDGGGIVADVSTPCPAMCSAK